MSLQIFRTTWGLPDDFDLTYFEPKDWEVGSLDTSGQTLTPIKQQMVGAVPDTITSSELLAQPQTLAALFREYLAQANVEIGLTREQLDFAVDGLENVLQSVVYELIHLQQTYRGEATAIQKHFDFLALYQSWLNDSVQIFAKTYIYVHGETHFEVNVVAYAYGRMGLRVQVAGNTYYVLDMRLACPAWRYMGTLGQELAVALCGALTATNQVYNHPK